jgi:hypothetical protein
MHQLQQWDAAEKIQFYLRFRRFVREDVMCSNYICVLNGISCRKMSEYYDGLNAYHE